jgi:hypothetical protein
MATFWIHTDGTTLLDARGFPPELGKRKHGTFPSAKATVWADKTAVLTFCQRKFKGNVIRDNGNTIEVDIPPDAHAVTDVDISMVFQLEMVWRSVWSNSGSSVRTLRFQEVTIV